MVLIISSLDDRSTIHVMDWLRYFDKPFVRVTSSYPVKISSIDLDDLINSEIIIRGTKYKISDFEKVWYRRSWLIIEPYTLGKFENDDLKQSINNQLFEERKTVEDFLLKCLYKNSLNSQFDNFINKMDVLNACKIYGIKIPKTLLTTNKERLIMFFKKHKKVITKNFSQGVFISTDEIGVETGTKKITKNMVDLLEDNFMPMLFQEMVPKSFEVRSFFLDGKFYSTAIFSQNDKKTMIDFRNYNHERPNRTPPFILPTSISEKLVKLMEHFKLNSGSIDLIVTPDGDFYFLEINPIGQFYQVSHPCNFYLEKKIAQYLIQ